MSVNLLLSYAFHAKTDLARIRGLMPCGRIMIDSGAFTAYTKGHQVDIVEYAEFLESWRGSYDHAVTLDAIGDPATTRANTVKLHRRGINVMPVFTRGDGLAEFDAMVRESGYVCVGGLVGMQKKVQLPRVAMLQRRAQDQGGGIHALGVASIAVLRQARPYSADSSSVSSGFQYGTVTVWNNQVLRTINIKAPVKLRGIRDQLTAHGFPVGAILDAGRMPGGQYRWVIMAAGATAFASADEYLKRTYPAPGISGSDPGPHLYNVAIQQNDARAMAGLDTTLHNENPPSIWRTAGRHHQCTRKQVVA